ncbi:hypothetical protein PPH41_42465, partial [Burkholderia gladioli]|nr:hypothetical protein [Burkholderia gladioli]
MFCWRAACSCTRYLRPLRDHLIGSLEFTLPRLAAVPGARRVYNALLDMAPVSALIERAAGVVDAPRLS